LVKAAILPDWTIYEDSAPITDSASTKLISTMVMEREQSLKKDAYVDYIVKVGDPIKTGDTLIRYDNAYDDPEATKLLQNLTADLRDELIESNITTESSHYTGEVADIKIFTSVPLEQLSPSLQKIVGVYWSGINKKTDLLKKYQNDDDTNYYKCGQIISEAAVPVKVDYRGKIRGTQVGEGVLFVFYVKFNDRMSKGDKLSAEFALKSVNSIVLPKGYEPYSEFRPDEEIQFITSPLAVSARKVPSVFFALFGNKILIEGKRHAKEAYLKD